MAQKQSYIQNDRFGNAYQLIGCKANDKGFCKGYIELSGKLYKIEPSKSNNEKYGYWVKITAVKKRPQNSSM
jgi:hypothetical protein